MESDQAYLEAIRHGKYSERVRGLRGKYDHIRTHWEDFITGFYLRPYLETIVREKQNSKGGLGFSTLAAAPGTAMNCSATSLTEQSCRSSITA